MNLHKKISLIKLEIIGSFILLILFLISQIHYNYFEIYDFIVILTFFLSYYLLSFLEHVYKNIFLRLLNFFFILFFILRMSTIPFDFINDYSIFFSDRIHPSNLIINKFANTESITKYLIFLNLHYLSFGFSLLVLRPLNRKLDFNFININSIKLILLLLLIQLLLLIINYIIFPVTNLPEQNVAIIKIFFHLFNLDKIYILLAFLLFLTWRLNYDFIIKKQIILILVPSILFPIFMFSSKSSLLEFSLYLFLFQFLLQKDFFLKAKHLKYLVLYIIGIFLFFSIAKLSKIFLYGDAYSIANFFEENSKTADSFFTNLRALQSVGYVFMERIGFFDYYLFTVSNEKYLSTLFVFENYIKIIIDKITPFFDLFNSMFLSREIPTLLFGSNEKVLQSSQITLFAEVYLLFGNFFFLFYFIFSYVLKISLNFLYKVQINQNIKILLSFFLLKSYFFYLIGYGMDTFIVNVIYDSIFILSILVGLKIYNYISKKYAT